jgi:hypothetical protein
VPAKSHNDLDGLGGLGETRPSSPRDQQIDKAIWLRLRNAPFFVAISVKDRINHLLSAMHCAGHAFRQATTLYLNARDAKVYELSS